MLHELATLFGELSSFLWFCVLGLLLVVVVLRISQSLVPTKDAFPGWYGFFLPGGWALRLFFALSLGRVVILFGILVTIKKFHFASLFCFGFFTLFLYLFRILAGSKWFVSIPFLNKAPEAKMKRYEKRLIKSKFIENDEMEAVEGEESHWKEVKELVETTESISSSNATKPSNSDTKAKKEQLKKEKAQKAFEKKQLAFEKKKQALAKKEERQREIGNIKKAPIRPWFFLYDIIYSGLLAASFWILYRMELELSKVKPMQGMWILVVFFVILILALIVVQFFVSINDSLRTDRIGATFSSKTGMFNLILLPCVLVSLIFPYLMLTSVNRYRLDGGGIQLVGSEKKSIPSGDITMSDEGCMITSEEESNFLDSTPIYHIGNHELVFPAYCAIVQPTLRLTNRVSPLSSLAWDKKGETYIVKENDKESTLGEFFLFNGVDTYYLPKGTTLTIGDQNITLESFSAVNVLFNQRVEIFDYEKGKLTVYGSEGEVCMALLTNRTQVNLSTDILYRENGDEQMLFLQPALLSDLS